MRSRKANKGGVIKDRKKYEGIQNLYDILRMFHFLCFHFFSESSLRLFFMSGYSRHKKKHSIECFSNS